MIKKEFREIILPAVIRIGVFIAPVFCLWVLMIVFSKPFDILGVVTAVFGVAVYWLANHYGTQVFKVEFRDRAFEYLLSLPYSKYRFLYNKIVPRLFVLLGLTLIYEILVLSILARSSNKAIFIINLFFRIEYFPVWMIFFFFCGFCFGFIENRNWRAGLNFFIFIFFITASFGMRAMFFSGEGHVVSQLTRSTLLAALLVTVILGIPFFSLLRKFDLKRLNLYRRKIFYLLMPPVIIVSTISVIMISS